MNVLTAETPFQAWEKLNTSLLSESQLAVACPSYKPEHKIRDRYQIYDTVLRITRWDGVHQPFLRISQERTIPYFPGYWQLPKKMTALQGVYLDWAKVDALAKYMDGHAFPKGGAPGIHFEANTVAMHGSCLTAFQVMRTPRDVTPTEVRIFIRASEITLTFFADLLLFDLIIQRLGLEGCAVQIYITYGYLHLQIGGIVLMGLYGEPYIRDKSDRIADYILKRLADNPETIRYRRRQRVTQIVHAWHDFFQKPRWAGVVAPYQEELE